MDRTQLRSLLSDAEEIRSLAARAVGLLDIVDGEAPSVDPAHGVHCGSASGSVIILPPHSPEWPDDLYPRATVIGRHPEFGRLVHELVSVVVRIDALRGPASRAGTGVFGRFFGLGRPDPAAESAAADLFLLLTDVRTGWTVSAVREVLSDAYLAAEQQRRNGVRLTPGPGAPADLYIEAARDAVIRGAGDNLGDIRFGRIDGTALAGARAAVERVLRHPDSEPVLRAEADAALAVLGRRRARQLMEQLPLEALKRVTDDRLRFTGLVEVGVTTVADILDTPIDRLIAVNGIGRQTASRLQAAARTLESEATANPTQRIGDEPLPEAVSLTRILSRYEQVGLLDEAERARRDRLIDFFRKLPVGPSPDGYDVIVRGAGALEQLLDDLRWAAVGPALLLPASVTDPGPAAWDDYLSRPARYQALLADLLRLDTVTGEDPTLLDGALIERIRGIRLNRNYLRDLHLRGYQSYGARFAVVQRRIILGDEMGLGKTVQAIAVAAHLAEERSSGDGGGGVGRTVVVCPASVVVNWSRELAAFCTLEVFVAHGPDKQVAVAAWRNRGGVLVCTYDGARTLDLGDPDVLIVDEAHMIKNPRAKRTIACTALAEASETVLLLTGTPLENRVDEFVNLVRIIRPDLVTRGMAELDADTFRRLIAPAYLRRNVTQVLDQLPDRVDETEWVELTEAEQQFYRESVAEGSWMGMRRAAWVTPTGRPAKLARLAEIVADAGDSGKRLLVFSFFLDVLELIADAFGESVVGVIDGSVPPARRQALVDSFGTAPGGSILLAQIQAGGQGLNIQAASVVVLTEPQVKPTQEDQAIARAYRMGQTGTVHVHRLIGADTVDERMLEILAVKRGVFDAFARTSDAAEVPDAVDISEPELARQIIAQERRRLGLADDGPEDVGVEDTGQRNTAG
ncbi:SNF2-related protein [Corynebacterium sp. CCM 9185]|uniref:DEAD/DEAH box helicase n=1 Tax=Corynebacterium marambiense TaxID=2765364 RepID=UPI001E36A296|nr:SNF2-related protein [Corynebacterium marambiense]MCK7663171.1 SNF2-related protein [Corynebacterium marambiense]